jgi:hypothetical protein
VSIFCYEGMIIDVLVAGILMEKKKQQELF